MKHAAPFVVSVLAVAACATGPDGPPPSPNYAAVATQPAPPNARLYAACFQQAADAETYRRASDGGGDELLLFTCTGAPARAMFDRLGPWSAQIGSEFAFEGRTYRSTARVIANLFGVDACSVDATGGDPTCVITFNAGDFLDQ